MVFFVVPRDTVRLGDQQVVGNRADQVVLKVVSERCFNQFEVAAGCLVVLSTYVDNGVIDLYKANFGRLTRNFGNQKY